MVAIGEVANWGGQVTSRWFTWVHSQMTLVARRLAPASAPPGGANSRPPPLGRPPARTPARPGAAGPPGGASRRPWRWGGPPAGALARRAAAPTSAGATDRASGSTYRNRAQ